MDMKMIEGFEANKDVIFSNSGVKCQFLRIQHARSSHVHTLFASVSKVGGGFGISPTSKNSKEDNGKLAQIRSYSNSMSMPDSGFKIIGVDELPNGEELEENLVKNKKKKRGLRFKVKIGNPSLRRLISGAIAGAVSRTAVAPLETIRTHLMVGSCGHSSIEVFNDIMKNEGWKGLFRGNLINVIRVAPSKAIEVCIKYPVFFLSVKLIVFLRPCVIKFS